MEVKEEDNQTMDTIMRDEDNAAEGMAHGEGDHSKTYRSFKKKYRKMKVLFDDRMLLSNQYFTMEQNGVNQLKAIRRENSQILDVLLDINNSAQIPADKRYDLTAHHSELNPIPSLVTLPDPAEAAEHTSEKWKAEYAAILALHEESSAMAAASSTASKSLAGLVNNIPHLSLRNPPIDPDFMADLHKLNGYMTAAEIQEHIDLLDHEIGYTSHSQPDALKNIVNTNHVDPINNPQSVYNWLRDNKPQVFLQDGEGSDKSSGKPGSLRGAGKRIAQPAPIKTDVLEFVEEDGAGYDALTPATKAVKRKRGAGGVGGDEDDGGYHPKAGRVEDGKGKKPRAPRKKKEDGTAGSARKRAKTKPTPAEAVVADGSAFGGD